MAAFYAKVKRGTPRELKGNIWEDVTVRIGVVHGKGRKVEKAEFLLWIKVSLDLDSPSNHITTPYGSLILDERFQGRIYLKSLFLKAKPAKPFKFCYNFFRGEVDRDRQRLSNWEEEAGILAKIWAEAIKLEDGSALLHLIDMLQDETQWADVNLAPDYISEETARTIWKSLQDKNVEVRQFYYFDQDGNKVTCPFHVLVLFNEPFFPSSFITQHHPSTTTHKADHLSGYRAHRQKSAERSSSLKASYLAVFEKVWAHTYT
jgi:hypothetical protein